MRARRVALASGKGGVGKSMLAAALGCCFACHGQRVLLVDLCTGQRGLDMPLSLESRIVFDLGDVLDGLCEAEQAIVQDARTGVSLLAARQITDTDALDAGALARLTEALAERFDWILLDAPSGAGQGLRAAAGAAEEALVISTPDNASLRGAERAAWLLGDLAPVGLVINRIREDLVREGLQYAPEVCSQVLDMRVTGVVPEDDAACRATLRGQPVSGDFPAALAIHNLMERLESPEVGLRPWQGEAAGKGKKRGKTRKWKGFRGKG